MSSTAGHVIRCKAALAWEAGKPLVIEEVDVAPPQQMEVRLKILFTSLCHTDVCFWEAKRSNNKLQHHIEVSECHQHILNVSSIAGPKSSLKETSLGATLNVAKPTKDSSVAVFGLGAVGLAMSLPIANHNVLVFAKYVFSKISVEVAILVASYFNKLQKEQGLQAKKFGVTEFVNPKEYNKPVQEVIAEMTDGGVDRSAECIGHIDAMISAFEYVHDSWVVAGLVGVPRKEAIFKTHPMNLLNERTLKGTFFGNYKPWSDLPSVVEKYMNKELELEKFITHQLPFSFINKAFDLMLKGEGLRCIIHIDH
ncbi:hypothetical protein CQW23_10218 [Capsicum baccatum]|uniref:alcohol dehydrogenase n=1 Tax=Capsicum baccatum TaxID=33114 RepID=A0A2G2WZ55_CAPBA|nr:hypothetical protein CQW23_10218 [Capsicum baccatum]